MQITARKQRFGLGNLKNAAIGLGIAGILTAGVAAYVVAIDESERVTGGNVPVVTQPDLGDEGVARSQIGRDMTGPDLSDEGVARSRISHLEMTGPIDGSLTRPGHVRPALREGVDTTGADDQGRFVPRPGEGLTAVDGGAGLSYLAPEARIYDEMLFAEQNWNLDQAPPGQIATTDQMALDQELWNLETPSSVQQATTLSGRVRHLTWEQAFFLEQNTIFLWDDTDDAPAVAIGVGLTA